MAKYNNIRIRGKQYKVKEEKDYPLDNFHAHKIMRLRIRMNNMRISIRDYTARIETKKSFLEDIYDHIEKGMVKYDKNKRNK